VSQVLGEEADKEDMEAAHHPWPALGALLLRDGLVDSDELEAVLTQQEDAGNHRISARRLGELLVERGTVTHAQVAQLLAEQYELPFIELTESDLNLRAATLLPEEQARKFSALPISVLPDASVLVATSDPPLVLFSDEFRRLLGVSLRYAVAAQDQVDGAIAFAAAHSPQLDGGTPANVVVLDPQVEPKDDAWLEGAADERSFAVPEHPRAHRSAALGALLVRDGLVTDKELEAALAQQRITGNRRLGEILVERGNVTRAQVARLVAEQYDLPFVEIEHSRIQHDATRLLPEGVARRLSAVPVGQSDDGSLLVVVSDPTNVVYADELRVALEAPLRFAVADPDGIEAAIDMLYEHSLAPLPHDADEHEHEQESLDAPQAVAAVPVEEEPTALDDPAGEEDAESPAHAEAPPLFDGVPEWEIEDDVLAVIEDLAVAPFDEVLSTAHAEDPYALEPGHDHAELLEPDSDPELELDPEPEPLVAVEELPAAAAQLDEDLLAEVEEAVETVAVALVEPDSADDSDDDADAGAGAVLEPTHSPDDEVLETVRRALALGATTIQLTPHPRGLVVRARIEGTLRELAVFAESRDALTTILDHAALGPVETLPRQGVLSLTDDERTVDLGASALPTRLGVHVTLRVPDRDGPPSSLSELGLGSSSEAVVREALRRPCGAVVVCGPVVSGRTTTLYALLHELTAPERAVTTIEAPIHRLAPGTSQVEANAAGDVSFASGLRAVLDSDPDVVLVGDLGDAETARVAFHAARTDRLVLTALEAPTASSAVTRLAELGVEPHLLSSTLSCVVAQHLVRRVCADCRETYYASAEEIARLGRPDEESGRRLLARGRGCTSCSGTGYRGYAVVFEILPLSERARSLIAEGVAASTIRDAAVEDGMTPLRDAAVALCLDGVTTAAEVLQVAVD
jgi:type II secretory ATPase GspE/PulE/Tfp pilus assembly ATPase PilB-like protein